MKKTVKKLAAVGLTLTSVVTIIMILVAIMAMEIMVQRKLQSLLMKLKSWLITLL